MQEQGLQGKTITLKLKPVTFDTFSVYLCNLSHPTHTLRTLSSLAGWLARSHAPCSVRCQ